MFCNPPISIKVQNVGKTYKLYDNPAERLKESLHPFRKKFHRAFHALQDISFDVYQGETIGIIGKNGSGKSTLLKILCGVLHPSCGNIWVNGRISALLELGTGFNPELTGLENVFYNGMILGYSEQEMQERLDSILGFADIGEFINQPVRTYSSGMFARLAFAVAINVDPEILVVDEALSVGDAAFQRKCFAKMENFRKQGKTILFVTHAEGTIVELCSRAMLLHEGQLIIDGSPKQVTGLYTKMMHSQQADIQSLRQEFVQSRRAQKDLLISSKETTSSQAYDETLHESFDPSLLPDSTLHYEEKGAKISDVKIFTLQDKKINVLVQGREYVYTYQIETTEDLFNVNFGMLIKTVQGGALGGGSYPGRNSFMEKLPGNRVYRVKWRFKANLNEGVYFTNAGVLAQNQNKINYSTRIVDAYGFKILPTHFMATAFIDFQPKFQLVGIAPSRGAKNGQENITLGI